MSHSFLFSPAFSYFYDTFICGNGSRWYVRRNTYMVSHAVGLTETLYIVDKHSENTNKFNLCCGNLSFLRTAQQLEPYPCFFY